MQGVHPPAVSFLFSMLPFYFYMLLILFLYATNILFYMLRICMLPLFPTIHIFHIYIITVIEEERASPEMIFRSKTTVLSTGEKIASILYIKIILNTHSSSHR